MFCLPDGAVSSLHWFDELHELPRKYIFGLDCLDFVWKLHNMHGGELLWHDWPLSCHCGLHHWEILRGISNIMFNVPDGAVSSLHWFDELHELPRR